MSGDSGGRPPPSPRRHGPGGHAWAAAVVLVLAVGGTPSGASASERLPEAAAVAAGASATPSGRAAAPLSRVHAALGLATVGTMIAASVVGEAVLMHRTEGDGGMPRELLVTHRAPAGTPTGLWAGTASLSFRLGAAGQHADRDVPPHGGRVQAVDGRWHYEVDFQAERLVVFLLDDKLNALPAEGRKGRVVLQAGGKTSTLPLEPAGAFLAAPLRQAPGETAVAVVQLDIDGQTRSARFEHSAHAAGQDGAPATGEHDHTSHSHAGDGAAGGATDGEAGHGEHGGHR